MENFSPAAEKPKKRGRNLVHPPHPEAVKSPEHEDLKIEVPRPVESEYEEFKIEAPVEDEQVLEASDVAVEEETVKKPRTRPPTPPPAAKVERSKRASITSNFDRSESGIPFDPTAPKIMPSIPPVPKDMLEKAKKKRAESAKADEISRAVEAHPEYRPIDKMEFTEQEEARFKQGEDEAAIADARGRIDSIDSYDERSKETIDISADDVEGNIRQAQAMMDNGELPKNFDLNDFGYLLRDERRINSELVNAGFLRARKLRAELKTTQKDLQEYTSQIRNVHSEHAEKTPVSAPARVRPGEGPDMSRITRATRQDLLALGYDQGFADRYESAVRDRASVVDLINHAGFFKRFGLRRQLEALDEDVGAMEEEIAHRRVQALRGAEEAKLTPGQLAEKRRNDEALAERNFIRRK